LIQVVDGRVRLLKENGHTTTVPVERLGADEQAYVSQYASTLRTLDSAKLAGN